MENNPIHLEEHKNISTKLKSLEEGQLEIVKTLFELKGRVYAASAISAGLVGLLNQMLK